MWRMQQRRRSQALEIYPLDLVKLQRFAPVGDPEELLQVGMLEEGRETQEIKGAGKYSQIRKGVEFIRHCVSYFYLESGLFKKPRTTKTLRREDKICVAKGLKNGICQNLCSKAG